MARNKLVHEVAYYKEDNKREPIRADELQDPVMFAVALALILFDETDQIRLQPRRVKGCRPHFHAPFEDEKSINSFRGMLAYESDDAHNKRVDNLLAKLKSRGEWKICINKFDSTTPERAYELSDYFWGSEVHRIVTSSAFVRHDIFGQRPEIRMSTKSPWVAIEVINTHYPEEETYAAFLEVSERFPLVIMFDLTAKPNYFLGMNEMAGLIKPIFAIFDGAVWKNATKRPEIKSAADLQSAISAML